MVTGASDRGIGGAIAEQLADDGASLALLSRTQPQRLLKRLQRAGRNVWWQSCDLTHSSQVTESIKAIVTRFGRLDVLINNAGMEFAAPIDDPDDTRWRALLEVNLHGTIHATRSCLADLRRPGGVIVNLTSALALGGCAGFSMYSASKAALIGFTQSLAWELAPAGIRVVAVAPGLVHTPMVHKHRKLLTREVWQQIEACHPLGMGLPQDVAAVVAFLASDEARWVTGVTLPVGWASHYPLPTQQFMS